jgi:hypothetical protein
MSTDEMLRTNDHIPRNAPLPSVGARSIAKACVVPMTIPSPMPNAAIARASATYEGLIASTVVPTARINKPGANENLRPKRSERIPLG